MAKGTRGPRVPLPAVTADEIRAAMQRFDREYRETKGWRNWEQNRLHRYAIIDEQGRRYPVKKVVSLATGIPVGNFSGGERPGFAARYVSDLGLHVEKFRVADE